MSIAKPGVPLNDCGCCEGQTVSTPLRIDNRHGLDTVSYRIGDYHRFRETMLSRLSSSELGALQGLTTRDQNDFSIALIDAWANVSEVLSFYQEYFANEGLLLTAKERLSVLEHARLIGYELNPGVAASSYLAFSMDEPLAAIENPVLESSVLAGTQVQSTPGPDETAEIFETLDDIQTRVRWNALRPRLNQPQIIDESMASIVVDGTTSFIKPGDTVLLVDQSEAKHIKQVNDLVVDEDAQTTQLIISGATTSPDVFSLDPKDPVGSYSLFDSKTTIDASVINLFVTYSWAVEDIVAIADTKHWDLAEITQRINTHPEVVTQVSSGMGVHGFHQTANLFGYNAMKIVEYNPETGAPLDITQWGEWDAEENDDTLYLDSAYSQITPGSYCILRIDDFEPEPFELSAAVTVSRSEYGISSKSSKLTLAGDSTVFSGATNAMKDVVRKAVVQAQSESLPLVPVALSETITGETILLNMADLELRSQQFIAVSGERIDQLGVNVSEVVQIDKVRLEHGFTEIAFATSLQYQYRRESVRLNANVAPASHGESVSEILGSGDAAVASQRFYLKQMPLTYISAEVPSGALSTLEIRVNDIVWHEVESFLGRASDERIFTTKLEDGGAVQVLFGDGVEGARLSSGNNNVIARYRRGIGLGGLVKAQQANMLLTRPLGIKGATNPVKSSGADDPEQLAAAQRNAPLGLLTLGRTVSLSDYEDFCRAFSGVAKARAVSVAKNGVPSIIITIAGPNGEVLDPVGKTHKSLLAALSDAGDPYTRFVLLPYRPAYFKLDAGLYIHSDYQADLVLEMAREIMRQQFSFDLRFFNQAVHLSEVISTLQKVDGVIAVDINHLYRSDASPVSPPPRSIMPVVSTGGLSAQQGAELITLDPAPLDQLRSKS